MNHEEAIQCALGYSWGREDASDVKTVGSQTLPARLPTSAFAEAYAKAWDEFNTEHRFMMVNVRDAYEMWQATNGLSIFEERYR